MIGMCVLSPIINGLSLGRNLPTGNPENLGATTTREKLQQFNRSPYAPGGTTTRNVWECSESRSTEHLMRCSDMPECTQEAAELSSSM